MAGTPALKEKKEVPEHILKYVPTKANEVTRLYHMLDSKNAKERVSAIREIAKSGDINLMALLVGKNNLPYKETQPVFMSLGKNPKVFEAILKNLESGDRQERHNATWVLSRLYPYLKETDMKKAIIALRDIAKELSESVHRNYSERVLDLNYIMSLLPEIANRERYYMFTSYTALLVPLLIRIVEENRLFVDKACEILGLIGDPLAVPALLKALGRNERYGKIYAAQALGRLKEPKAVDMLIKMVHEPPGTREEIKYHLGTDPDRFFAVRALGEIGDPRAIPALIYATNDPNMRVRFLAVRSLGDFKDSRSVIALIEKLTEENGDVRSAAITALGKLGDPRAIPALIRMSEEDSEAGLQRYAASTAKMLRKSQKSSQ